MTLADVAALLMDVASEARSRGNDYEDEQAQTAAATIRRWMPVIDAAATLTTHLDRMDWPYPNSQYVHAVGDAYRAATTIGENRNA